jgi:hypothetical protein
MQRDFYFDTEDNFEVIISPFIDKRNGYLFVINPNGARADALVPSLGYYTLAERAEGGKNAAIVVYKIGDSNK